MCAKKQSVEIVVKAIVMYVAALCVIIACSCVSMFEAKYVYPQCSGTEITTHISAGSTKTTFSFPESMTDLKITCLSYNLTYYLEGNDDPSWECGSEPRLSVFSYYLRVSTPGENGVMIIKDYHMRDLLEGSITSWTIRTAAPSTFELIFSYPEKLVPCDIIFQNVLSYVASNTTNTDNNNNSDSSNNKDDGTSSVAPKNNYNAAYAIGDGVNNDGHSDFLNDNNDNDNDNKTVLPPQAIYPALMKTTPPMIFAGRKVRSYVLVQHISAEFASLAYNDEITLTSYDSTCEKPHHVRYMRYETNVPRVIVAHHEPELLSIHSITFNEPGAFRLCYKHHDELTAHEMATISVFSNNPAYYTVEVDGKETEHVYVNTPITLKFHGYKLDGRPGADDAKLIQPDSDCETGEAIIRVTPTLFPIGPSDCFGDLCTTTEWTWSLSKLGQFKVCYKRSHAGLWGEVPSISETAPGTLPDTSADTHGIPTPHNPETNAACAMAPESTPTNPWQHYNGMELTLETTNFSSSMPHKLIGLMCVPRPALSIVHVGHNAIGFVTILFSVNCESALVNGTRQCDSMERYNYLMHLSNTDSPLLYEHQIISVRGVTELIVIDDDAAVVIHERARFALILGIAILFLVLSFSALFGVKKYRERRAYLVQFGLEDGDVNDMYGNVQNHVEENMAEVVKASTMGNEHPEHVQEAKTISLV